MTFREKMILMVGIVAGMTIVLVAVLVTLLRHDPGPAVGTAKAPVLEIAQGVSLELYDGSVWYDHADPHTATVKEPQKLRFGILGQEEREGMTVEMRSGGCPDPARAAQNDLSDEKQRAVDLYHHNAADLGNMLFFGALGANEQHAYAGYCLRNSARDEVFTKLFLPIGPQCLVLTSRDHRGNECPIADVERLARALRIRE